MRKADAPNPCYNGGGRRIAGRGHLEEERKRAYWESRKTIPTRAHKTCLTVEIEVLPEGDEWGNFTAGRRGGWEAVEGPLDRKH